ncbi:hypothetical protein [Nocardia sp. NPDC004415]
MGVVDGHREYPKRTWQRPRDVPAGSATARQISLMYEFVSSQVGGAEFEWEWLAGRRRAMNAGERVRAPFGYLMDRVFFGLEDCAIDPELAEDGDLTEEELRELVRAVVGKLELL